MKQLYITLLLALCSFAPQASAQETSGPGWLMGDSLMQRINERFHGSELQKKLLNKRYSQYMAAVRAQQWAEAYPAYKEVVVTCPNLTEHIYMHASSVIFPQLLAQERDENMKKLFLADWLDVYDKRIKYIDTFLKDNPTPQKANSKGDLMVWKAYYNSLKAFEIDSTYSKEEAYQMLRDAFDEVAQNGGRDILPHAIWQYFNLSYELFMQDPTKYREQFLQDYLSSTEICQTKLDEAKVKEAEGDMAGARKIVDDYGYYRDAMENNFLFSKAADPERLVEMFTPRVEDRKDDVAYLNQVLNLLMQNNCDTMPVYYRAAELAYGIKPSFVSAIGMGRKYMRDDDINNGLRAYKEALRLAEADGFSNAQKALVSLSIGQSLVSSNMLDDAEDYFVQAVTYNQELEGRVEYQRARAYRQQVKPTPPIYQAKKGESAANFRRSANDCNAAAAVNQQNAKLCTKMLEACAIAMLDITYKERAEKLRAWAAEHHTTYAQRAINYSDNAAQYAKAAGQLSKKEEEDAFWNGQK